MRLTLWTRAVAVLALLPLAGAAGCVTIGKYDALVERVSALENEQKAQQEMMQRDMQRLENLNSLLKEAKDTLAQNGAELLARVDEVDQRSRRNAGALEELKFSADRASQLVTQVVEFLDRKFGTTITVLPSNLPTTPDGLYKAGLERVQQGKAKEARAILRQYLEKFPQGLEAADAQFLVGETYLAERAFESALVEYQTVFDMYKTSPRMPEALLRIAEILTQQNECAKAKAVYELVPSKSPQGPVAKDRVKALKGKCK